MNTGSTPSTRTEPRVMAAAYAQVPPTTRSPTVRWVVGCSASTPSMVMVAVPTPSIRAPIWASNCARSMISGSRAALSMIVVPSASTAAIRMFSVAPTLGKSSPIEAPCSLLARPTTLPCSMFIVAPIARRPDWCMSSGREPMASPAGQRHLGPAAATHQRAQHADRRPQPADGREVGVVGQLGRCGDGHHVALDRHHCTEAAQHVGHQRDVQDLRAVRDRRGALGQQRGRHQLQHAVLGTGHLDGAGEPGPAGDQEAFHGWHSNRPTSPAPAADARRPIAGRGP